MKKIYTFIFVLFVLLLAGCTSIQEIQIDSASLGKMPWESAPFKASYEAMNSAADTISLKDEKSVKILLHQGYFSFDGSGSLESRFKWVYKILDQSGIENWSSTQIAWTPWNQSRPDIKVRVTNPDGKSWVLSKDHIIEQAESVESANIYSDRMILRAPFPRVMIGSIIEEEITLHNTLPKFDTGLTKSWYFESSQPVFMNRVVIDVPEGLPFNYRVFKKDDLKPTVEAMPNGKKYIFEYGNVPISDKIESGLPVDEPHWVKLVFSTGESWHKVSSVYNRIIEEKIEASDFSPYLKEIGVLNDAFKQAVAATQWLNKKIRYTGLELGENSIVPALPAETLSRGFGDCKDKAVIVTGVLREAGYDAHVALLAAGTAEDIIPDFPGLGGFNHAIVYVGGENPFFIDPTSEFSYNGYLPLGDQGRWALVISPDTKKVIKTPVYPSRRNRTDKEVVYRLKDFGYGDVEESRTYYGSLDSYYRNSYMYSGKENLEKSFDEYIKNNYRFGDRESLDYSSPDDFSKPFNVKLKIKGAGRGFSEEMSASVALMQSQILDRLPEVFLSKDEDEKPRENSYSFYQPFVYKVRYVIHPPFGFVPRKIPESEFIKLGTVSLSKKFEIEDNVVTATIILDSGKKILTPEEFEETRKAVFGFKDEKPIIINFEHIGYKLMSEGDYKGSIREFRKYCDLEKTKAIHQIRLAGALLQAGLGDDAKRAALEAVSLEPDSPEAQAKLAWVLQFDSLGRRLLPGYDRQGAVKAYKKAIELDSDNWLYHANFAILLEYDENGMRYTPYSNLDDAIEEYKVIGDKLSEKGMELNLVSDYLFSGGYKELLGLLDKVKSKGTSSLYKVVTYAAMGDMDRAFAEAEKSGSMGEKRSTLSGAGDLLVRIRKFKAAAALFREAAKGSNDALSLETRASTFEKTVPFEGITFNLSAPEDVVRKFFKDMYTSRGKNFTSLKELVIPQIYSDGMDPEYKGSFRANWLSLRKQSVSSGIPLEAILDLLLADMKFQKEKDPRGGYHLKLIQSGLGTNLDSNYYLVKNGDSFRIAGMDNFFNHLGPIVSGYLSKGSFDTAKVWLDWFIKDFSSYNRGSDDPFYGHPVQQFWKTRGVRTPQKALYAAAAIMCMDEDTAADAVKILEKGRKGVSKERDIKAFDYALYFGYQTLKNNDGMYRMAKELYTVYPESDFAWNSWLDALLRTDRGDELVTITRERLREDPSDSTAVNMLINYYFSKMNFEKVDEVFKEQLSQNRESARLYNAVAWMYLFKAERDPVGLEYARKAVNLSGNRSVAITHTLASQYAEAGRCREARKSIDEVLRLSGSDEPSSDDWYVLGRIAEEYGMTSSAIKYYSRVKKPEDKSELYNTAYVLAQRRLKKLIR